MKTVGNEIAKDLEKLEVGIDLFIITHIDIDHIGGAVSLLPVCQCLSETASFTKNLGAVWFNGYRHLEEVWDLLGSVDGQLTQYEYLGSDGKKQTETSLRADRIQLIDEVSARTDQATD